MSKVPQNTSYSPSMLYFFSLAFVTIKYTTDFFFPFVYCLLSHWNVATPGRWRFLSVFFIIVSSELQQSLECSRHFVTVRQINDFFCSLHPVNVNLCLPCRHTSVREVLGHPGGWGWAPWLCISQGLTSIHFLEDGHFKLNNEVEGGHDLVRGRSRYIKQTLIDIVIKSLVPGSNRYREH